MERTEDFGEFGSSHKVVLYVEKSRLCIEAT